jgi:hypothetical protein
MKALKWLYLGIAVIVVLVLHTLDDFQFPLAVHWLDWLQLWSYRWFPWLGRFHIPDPSWIPCLEVGYGLFMVMAFATFLLVRNDSSDRLEGKLNKRSKRKKEEDEFAS